MSLINSIHVFLLFHFGPSTVLYHKYFILSGKITHHITTQLQYTKKVLARLLDEAKGFKTN